MKKTKAIIVTGPTATGKTSLAVKLAREFNGEIISADSRQVYKGLDLGTGKDIEEYGVGDSAVKYHLIDNCSPGEIYHLKQFNYDAKKLIVDISSRNRLPIIAGGTALYIDSLISNYEFPINAPDLQLRNSLKNKSTEELAEYLKTNNPELFNKLENKNSRPRLVRAIESVLSVKEQRFEISNDITFDCLIIGTYFERTKVHERIAIRLEQRIEAGMIEEVENLHKNGLSWERLDSFGLEYRYISKYIKGELSLDEMKSALLAKIRKLARSQDVWFRKMEQKGHKIYWTKEGNYKQSCQLVQTFLENKILPEPQIKLKDIYYGPKAQ